MKCWYLPNKYWYFANVELGAFSEFKGFLHKTEVFGSLLLSFHNKSCPIGKSNFSAFIFTKNYRFSFIISDFRLILRKSLYFDNADAYLLCTHDLLCQACHMQSKYALAFSKYKLFRKMHLKSLIINGFW